MKMQEFINKMGIAFKTCGWCKKKFKTGTGRKVHEAKHKRNNERQPGLGEEQR